MKDRPAWSQLASLLLNSRTLFMDAHGHTRLAELLSLFYCPGSGIDKTVIGCITSVSSCQEVVPVISDNHIFASLGCHFYLRFDKASVAE